ncbi:MAG: riboflavin biosynthesis protein [Oligoflexia bacterium]|nr:MAG: riboflavin biosynthesis protein [Oligoflexia bacterium]
MRSLEDLKDFQGQYFQKRISLLIGNFDGVHLGHRALIQVSQDWCRRNSGVSVLLTFNPHPIQFFKPEQEYSRLFDFDDLAEQLDELGVDGLYIQKFDQDFSRRPAEEFLEQFIGQNFKPGQIVVGHDFRFGKGRSGDGGLIASYAKKHQIEFSQIAPFMIDNERVSTSKIREYLYGGDFERVRRYLGRDFSIRGEVVRGDQRGRTIGFPTLNILPTVSGAWLAGVYATKVIIQGKLYNSVTNIGVRPTIQLLEGVKTIETHVFDFSDEIYGQKVQLIFHKYLRSERKFQSLDELKTQIHKDCLQAKKALV